MCAVGPQMHEETELTVADLTQMLSKQFDRGAGGGGDAMRM